MRLLGFKTPKPRQFSYKPRFFDPEKEAIEQRRRELGLGEPSEKHEQLRDRIDYAWRRKDKRMVQRNSSLSLLIAVILVALLLYFIFR